ncbi:MAG: c-type cytochrome domain-containing protein [Limisphaerales bacterium]
MKLLKTQQGLALIASAAIVFAPSQARGEQKVDFAKDLQPLFEQTCISCHGPDKQKGKLRLDSKEAVLKGGKDGPVIVPGQAAKSELYRRITLPAGDDDIMPQKASPLIKAQTDLVRDWINQGAAWPEGLVLTAVATNATPASAAAAPSPGPKLPDVKPTAAELGAVAKFDALGVSVRPIAMNVGLREANFRPLGASVTDAVLAPLKDVLSLTDLNLAGTKVTDAGLAALEGLTNLTRLHLEHTKITDAGLAHLKKLVNLAYLNLFDTPVTDAGLESLKGLTGLKHLYLWQSKVTAAGTAKLHQALPDVEISTGENLSSLTAPAEKKDEQK